MKLLLIRHAESTGNLEQRMPGWNEDALSETGMLQARTLARYLLKENGQPSHLYSSPLQRAVQTAQILLDYSQSGFKIQTDVNLKELHNGVFQGLTWQEAQASYPELCQALETSPDWISIPGAESLQTACDRAQFFIQTLLTQHQNSDQIWVVTHGGILQYLVAALLRSDRTWGLQIRSTALFEFWLDLERWQTKDQNRFNPCLWQIRRFNQTPQLGL